LRNVDAAQADNRTRDYDFDMLSVNFGASLTPGVELRQLYSSAAADTPGSSNLSGIKDPVVDELIELIINTETRPELVTRVRALDRVLLHGHYGVPNWYQDQYRVAYWNKFGMPEIHPKYVSMAAGAVNAWWVDRARDGSVTAQKEQLEKP
jgi:microcin C transport system substrate-binding protein